MMRGGGRADDIALSAKASAQKDPLKSVKRGGLKGLEECVEKGVGKGGLKVAREGVEKYNYIIKYSLPSFN